MTATAVHRCRFIEFNHHPINCISFPTCVEDEDAGRFAVARQNGDIEIWNEQDDFFLENVICGGEGSSVEAMAWVGNRLFTAGLYCNIIEWDLSTFTPKTREDSYGGPVWSMTANGTGSKLAIGCEDGSARIFDITDGGIVFTTQLDPQPDCRILSLSWHGDILACGGSNGLVMVWHIPTRRCLQRISVQTKKSKSSSACFVWSVILLNDNTVVTGDSKGKVQFWSVKHGTQHCSVQTHKADVLSLAYDVSQDCIYAAGIDHAIVQLKSTKEQGNSWVATAKRRQHTADIRALALSQSGLVVSGGVDTNLITTPSKSFHNHKCSHRKIPPYRQQSVCHLAKDSHLLISQHDHRLDLWSLTSGEDTFQISQANHRRIDLERPKPIRLKPKSGHNIRCSCISSKGNLLAFSTLAGVRVFRILHDDQGIVNLERIKGLPDMLPALTMQAAADGSKVFMMSVDGNITVLALGDDPCVSRVMLPIQHSSTFVVGATLLAISGDEQWLAVCVTGQLFVVNLDSLQFYLKLSPTKHQPTAMAYQPHSDYLIVSDTQHEIYVYDTGKGLLAEHHAALADAVRSSWSGKEKIINISFLNLSNQVVFGHHSGFLTVTLPKEVPEASSPKRKANKALASLEKPACRMVKRYQPLLFVDVLSNGSLVLVEN